MPGMLSAILWNINRKSKDLKFFELGEIYLKSGENKFVEKKKNYDGSIVISLTDKGRLKILNMRFKSLSKKREPWDGRWRLVAFDIPETCRKGRSALRYKMRLAGFYELQESLFLYPYDCEKEIAEFAKLFKLEKYIRFALLEYIDNQDDIKKIFKIS